MAEEQEQRGSVCSPHSQHTHWATAWGHGGSDWGLLPDHRLLNQSAMLVLCAVLGSLLSWLTLYRLLCAAFWAHSAEWNCRLVTLSHGVVIVLLTAYVVFIDGPWPLTHAGSENTELQVLSLCVCLGYFLFDMSWCVLHRSEGPVMMAHHGASILGILLTLWLGSSGCETCAVIFGSELTNPLLQSRWFLRESGQYDSLLGDAVDVLFIVLFACVRVGVGTVMFYCELTSPRPALVMKLGGVAMYALAWVFMVDIARFGYKKSRTKYRRWKERQLRETGKAQDLTK